MRSFVSSNPSFYSTVGAAAGSSRIAHVSAPVVNVRQHASSSFAKPAVYTGAFVQPAQHTFSHAVPVVKTAHVQSHIIQPVIKETKIVQAAVPPAPKPSVRFSGFGLAPVKLDPIPVRTEEVKIEKPEVAPVATAYNVPQFRQVTFPVAKPAVRPVYYSHVRAVEADSLEDQDDASTFFRSANSRVFDDSHEVDDRVVIHHASKPSVTTYNAGSTHSFVTTDSLEDQDDRSFFRSARSGTFRTDDSFEDKDNVVDHQTFNHGSSPSVMTYSAPAASSASARFYSVGQDISTEDEDDTDEGAVFRYFRSSRNIPNKVYDGSLEENDDDQVFVSAGNIPASFRSAFATPYTVFSSNDDDRDDDTDDFHDDDLYDRKKRSTDVDEDEDEDEDDEEDLPKPLFKSAAGNDDDDNDQDDGDDDDDDNSPKPVVYHDLTGTQY